MEPQEQKKPSEENRLLGYFIGICIGLIPLILVFIAIGQSNVGNWLGAVPLYLYLAEWPVAILCLYFRRTRFLGYGLLTMAFISPVVYYISCVVAIQQHLICVYRCPPPTR